MNYCNNILETIGNTPLIKLNSITSEVQSLVLAKVEYFNPGNSVKDRMAVKMVEDAEKDGRLKSGGTIVEGTSGNTGMGLALAAIVKGYKLICVTTDKQSKEKVDVLFYPDIGMSIEFYFLSLIRVSANSLFGFSMNFSISLEIFSFDNSSLASIYSELELSRGKSKPSKYQPDK